jgi:hypothetical protein
MSGLPWPVSTGEFDFEFAWNTAGRLPDETEIQP